MKGIEVNLGDMLACRERRAAMQDMLIRKYHCTLVSFSMNIPGPIKTNEAIRAAFEQGKLQLLNELAAAPLKMYEQHEPTGDELMLAADLPAEEVKKVTMKIEEENPLGRLFDMDVITPGGDKISRKSYRKCLICGRQAQECARSRPHQVSEMQEAVERMLDLLQPVSSPQNPLQNQ